MKKKLSLGICSDDIELYGIDLPRDFFRYMNQPVNIWEGTVVSCKTESDKRIFEIDCSLEKSLVVNDYLVNRSHSGVSFEKGAHVIVCVKARKLIPLFSADDAVIRSMEK